MNEKDVTIGSSVEAVYDLKTDSFSFVSTSVDSYSYSVCVDYSHIPMNFHYFVNEFINRSTVPLNIPFISRKDLVASLLNKDNFIAGNVVDLVDLDEDEQQESIDDMIALATPEELDEAIEIMNDYNYGQDVNLNEKYNDRILKPSGR